MTFPDSVQFNTLEEVLSADLNRQGGLAGKGVQDFAAELESGIDLSPGARACTSKGLDCSPSSGVAVLITAGVLNKFDPAAPGDDASQYLVGRLDDDTVVALPAADGALPQLSVVYATITQTLSDQTVRNILTLPSRVITPTPIYKSSRPTLTLTAAAGTPSATPALPGVPAGAVALWYVYQPALAVVVTSDQLIDGRFRYVPSPLSRKHGREFGLYVDGSATSLASLEIGSGLAFSNGAKIDHTLNQTFVGSAILPAGSGALAASTEYSVYAITIGQGPTVPMGKDVVSGVAFVLSTIAPDSVGRPSLAIQYRPLFGLGIDNVLVSTLDALYIGTATTDASGVNFQIGLDGVPLNRDGTLKDLVSSQRGGFPGLSPGWLRAPEFSWVDASTVSVGLCSPIIGGVPGLYGGASATIPANLVAGEVEVANTWYYCYIRPAVSAAARSRGTVRHYSLVLSAVPPTAIGNFPAPETGFQLFDYLFVGSFLNNSASDIRSFKRIGSRTIFRDSDLTYSSLLLTAPATVQIPVFLPSTSRVATVIADAQLIASGAGAFEGDVFLYQDTLTPGPSAFWFTRGVAAAASATEAWNAITFDMPTTAPSTVAGAGGLAEFRANQDNLLNGNFNLNVVQTGYLEQLVL